MAKKKVKYKAKNFTPTPKHLYAEFMNDQVTGKVKAEILTEKKDRNGDLEFEIQIEN